MFSDCILLVEDDPVLGPLVQRVLQADGYRIFSATTALEALRIWEDTSHSVPVALVDLTLAGEIGGEALARKLKTDNSSLRIVVTSGRLLSAEFEGFSNMTFLQKPFALPELLSAIRAAFIFSRRRSRPN